MSDQPKPKRKTVNGVTRSVIFTRDQDDRLNRLIEAVDEVPNRNQFFRLCADKMVPSDVKSLLGRP